MRPLAPLALTVGVPGVEDAAVSAGAMALPDRANGLTAPSVLTTSEPVFAPVVVGLKATVTVHEAPGATVPPTAQLPPVTLNCGLTDMSSTLKAAVPPLVKVTALLAEAEPT